jgi:hypothetical protein
VGTDANGKALRLIPVTLRRERSERRRTTVQAVIVVHDVVDARYAPVDPACVTAAGQLTWRRGHLVSDCEELDPIFDFVSRNGISTRRGTSTAPLGARLRTGFAQKIDGDAVLFSCSRVGLRPITAYVAFYEVAARVKRHRRPRCVSDAFRPT